MLQISMLNIKQFNFFLLTLRRLKINYQTKLFLSPFTLNEAFLILLFYNYRKPLATAGSKTKKSDPEYRNSNPEYRTCRIRIKLITFW